jgi:hypothetical protein
MARLLATDLADLPQAIARVRQVPASSARAVEAAFLEGEWRAGIGDIAGATLAYARMRDRIELAKDPGDHAVEWLMRAARFERDVQRDALSAERHLSVALRLSPRSRKVADAYREVAAIVAARSQRDRERGREPGPLDTSPPAPGTLPPPADEPALGTLPPPPPLPDESVLAELAAAVRAHPSDQSSLLELAEALERVGHDQELSALLSARHPGAEPAGHAPLGERLRRVVSRLEQAASREGREDEAKLYRAVLAALVQ